MDKISVLESKAINVAMQSLWPKAIEYNLAIIKIEKNNFDAIMRLAFSYLQNDNIRNAKKYYHKALKLQPANVTVMRNLEKIKVLENRKVKSGHQKNISLNPYLFLEIPGKTKTVTLVNLGQKNILAGLSTGQEVLIVPKKRKIETRTKNKEYVGTLPDDISKRLTIFIKAGSLFSVYIKESSLNQVIIFLKEEKKGKKVTKYASFPTNFQVNITDMVEATDEALGEEENEELSEVDLEKLAESLASEEKEYLPFDHQEPEEEREE